MAYQKTTWQDGATPLSANNMNNIENGIVTLEESISDLDTAKVDKETNKGLSTNDYTTAEKNKLSGIEAGAQVNPDAATTSAAGLMSAADKTKLNGIASGAEVNQNAFSNVKVGSTTIAADGKTDTLELVAGSNVTLTPDATNDKVTIAATNTTYNDATTSTHGLMTAADKTKLNALPDLIAGSFVYSGASATEITHQDNRLLNKSFVIVSAQDAGNPPLRASIIEDSSVTQAWVKIFLASAITTGRYNYIAW